MNREETIKVLTSAVAGLMAGKPVPRSGGPEFQHIRDALAAVLATDEPQEAAEISARFGFAVMHELAGVLRAQIARERTTLYRNPERK